jgi:hypothetical protein
MFWKIQICGVWITTSQLRDIPRNASTCTDYFHALPKCTNEIRSIQGEGSGDAHLDVTCSVPNTVVPGRSVRQAGSEGQATTPEAV